MRPHGLRHAIIDWRVGQNSSAQMGRNSLSLPRDLQPGRGPERGGAAGCGAGLFNALDLPLGESDVPQVSGEVNGLTLDGIPETANV